MSFDFSSLSADPLFYFLEHSALFVAVMAVVFFSLGLAFGWLTWARYKWQRHELLAECESMKDEIALLKRKVAEQASRASTLGETTPETETKHDELPHAKPDPVVHSFLNTAASILLPSDVVHPEKAVVDPAPIKARAAAPEVVTVTAPAEHVLQSVIDHPPPHDPPGAHAGDQTPPVATPLDDLNDGQPETTPPSSAAEAAGHENITGSLRPNGDSSKLVSDPHRGLIYAVPPANADDLSHLKGVASIIEGKLHEFGVYTFKQIALWNDENIREFSDLLSFKDRIRREQWVEQARELHFQKYGERL